MKTIDNKKIIRKRYNRYQNQSANHFVKIKTDSNSFHTQLNDSNF